jgi:hypothetical protein
VLVDGGANCCQTTTPVHVQADECPVCLVAGVVVVDGASRGAAAEVEEPLGCCDAEAGMTNGAPDAAAFPAMAMGV